MNQTLETMWKRRSIRKFKPDPVNPQDLNLILEAARRAPTGNNAQNWRLIALFIAQGCGAGSLAA